MRFLKEAAALYSSLYPPCFTVTFSRTKLDLLSIQKALVAAYEIGRAEGAGALIPAGASFKYGDLVRKKSGSWWEGRVVGFYSTKQTPEGYDVQLITPDDNGPVQLYPVSALEAAPTPEAE